MDFSLNEVQTMLADSIEKFVANDYDFETRQKYAASECGYSKSVWQTFADLGWTAITFSEDDGGFDGGGNHIYTQTVGAFTATLLVDPDVAVNADILM